MKKNIIIGILIVLVIGLGITVFMLKNKEINNEKNTPVEKEDIIKNLSVSDYETMKNQIELFDTTLLKYYPIEDLNELPNNIKLLALISNSKKTDTKMFTKAEMEETKNRIFGENFKYNDNDIVLNEETIYEFKDNVYKEIELQPHGMRADVYKTYVISGKYNETKDIYYINTKILYGLECDETCLNNKFYDSIKRDNLIYQIPEDDIENLISLDEVYKQVKDKLPTTIYTFIKENGNFKLQKVEVKQIDKN